MNRAWIDFIRFIARANDKSAVISKSRSWVVGEFPNDDFWIPEGRKEKGKRESGAGVADMNRNSSGDRALPDSLFNYAAVAQERA